MDVARLRQWVTLGALSIALVHVVFPGLAIDAVALVLVIVAVVPWLAPLFKSLQLPGGWKVEFQDLQKVAAKADDAGLLSPPVSPEPEYAFQSVADRDPNLALAGLRIELEKRLVRLAEAHDIGTHMQGMARLLRELARRGILSEDEESVLSDLVHLLNAAVHGASVDPRATEWAMDVGPQLIQSFEEKLAQ
ncbi:MAG TPA: hypothetical protein VN598_03695 [Usitatibacter sp.]|nr:hypothetical protein [Usitatibacter sp.]